MRLFLLTISLTILSARCACYRLLLLFNILSARCAYSAGFALFLVKYAYSFLKPHRGENMVT
jgi:hypothetical protein